MQVDKERRPVAAAEEAALPLAALGLVLDLLVVGAASAVEAAAVLEAAAVVAGVVASPARSADFVYRSRKKIINSVGCD